jgi:glycosyltransferase involved in cell wall biosynthesis
LTHFEIGRCHDFAMRVSVVLPNCDYLSPPKADSLHGAFLSTSKFMSWVANSPEFEKLEVFLPPDQMADDQSLQAAAVHTLLEENRGKGRLSFFPYHVMPEVWNDGAPRILRSLDPHFMARDRYLRDSFAVGPTALSVDTHIMAAHDIWQSFKSVLSAPEVPFDGLQCVSGTLRETFISTFAELGYSSIPFRMDVIGRSVDTELFRPPTPAEKVQARQKLGIPENANVAIFHSRVGPHSKADLYPFVQAFAECSTADDWLIVGGPPTSEKAYENLDKWLTEAGVIGRTRLIGPCPQAEVRNRLWAADFFVLPCDNASEGQGIAPVEAMGCGLPAFVSEWDGMRDKVREGINGLFIPTFWVPGSSRIGEFSPLTPLLTECLLLSQCIVMDQRILTEKLSLLFRDRALRKRLGEGARATAESVSPNEIHRLLLATFREQLAAAADEASAQRESRRATARELIYPTNYEKILSRMGTRSILPEESVELTFRGREFLLGKFELPISEEIAMLTNPQEMTILITQLAHGPQQIESLIDSHRGVVRNQKMFIVAILLKRGIIQLTKSG